MIIFRAHKGSGPTNESHTVGLHLNYTFRAISIISHTHDVIKIDSKESDQKIKSEDFSQIINNFWISSPKLWNLCHKECFICIEIFHNSTERQEIDHKSKLVVRRFTGSSEEKVFNFGLKLFFITEMMFHHYFYFVYHISNHVIER